VHIIIFTDTDLDGAGSALLLNRLFQGHDVITVETTEATILNEFKSRWSTLDHFDKIFVCDLCLNEEQAETINRDNVVVIDHHDIHVQHVCKYTKAKSIVTDYTSCTKLIADKFKAKLNLDDRLTSLVNLIDQYDCWSFNFPNELEPVRLNAIYNTYNKPKWEKFITSFKDGLREYNIHEKNSIKLFFKKFAEQLINPKFTGEVKGYKIISTFVTSHVNEVGHYLVNKYDADIAIMVNLEKHFVSFRKNSNCKADLSILATTLCEGGGSHKLAGGKLTEKFMNFSQTFQPL
jgi:oligoribonuclease NrnB/cAMP/cGMP phosphodiesterase (DHH superfamily)